MIGSRKRGQGKQFIKVYLNYVMKPNADSISAENRFYKTVSVCEGIYNEPGGIYAIRHDT